MKKRLAVYQALVPLLNPDGGTPVDSFQLAEMMGIALFHVRRNAYAVLAHLIKVANSKTCNKVLKFLKANQLSEAIELLSSGIPSYEYGNWDTLATELEVVDDNNSEGQNGEEDQN